MPGVNPVEVGMRRVAWVFVFIFVVSGPLFASQMEVTLKEGEPFLKSLVKHDISYKEAVLVVNALSRYVSLSRLRPGFKYIIEYEGKVPVRLVVPYDVGKVYDVDLRRILVTPRNLRVKRENRVICGVLDAGGSVYYSIYRKTGDAGLAYQFVRIFRHRIDFHTWTRPGDYYGFVCEYLEDDFGNSRYGRILAARYVGKKVKAEAVYYKGAYYDGKGYPLVGAFLASPLDAGWLRAPLRYRRISSRFSYHRRHPILGIVRPHLGVDYAAPMGTPIRSVADGVVIWKGWIGGYGRTVKIRHRGGIITQYAHMSRYARGLRVGQRVKKGQVIGYVGMSGLATGPHLDFRIKVGGRFVNPLRFLSRHARSYRRVRLAKKRLKGEALSYVRAQLEKLDVMLASAKMASDGVN